MRKLSIIPFLVLLSLPLAAQQTAQEIQIRSLEDILTELPSSNSRILPLEAFVGYILANHPVVKQADLLPEIAKQEIRLAKGAFDPKIKSNWDVKSFKDTNYYDIFNTSLEIPTWFPLDPKLSLDRNDGVFLNRERSIPESDDFHQVTAALSLPIGRGLFIDERRAAVKQAKIFTEINNAERIKMINKILLSAAKDYWNWYFAYCNYRLVNESLRISEDIFRRVKLDFSFGEVAVVDTVQAAITVQNRRIDQTTALIEFNRTGLILSNYLWNENSVPLEITEELVPQIIFENQAAVPLAELDSITQIALVNHPDLVKTEGKINQLFVEEKLAKENLKPRVDLSYGLINSPIGSNGDFERINVREDYKLGFAFEFPIFNRKQRAKLGKTRIKIDQATFDLNLRRQEIVNEISAGYFALNNSRDMLGLIQDAVDNYNRLLEAEIFNLNIGESDQFKINFQQDKLLETQIKLMKIRADVEKAKVNLFWSAGIPYLNFESPYLD